MGLKANKIETKNVEEKIYVELQGILRWKKLAIQNYMDYSNNYVSEKMKLITKEGGTKVV